MSLPQWAALFAVAALGWGAPVALAGHELSYYPAFYPSDITLTVMDAATAGAGLKGNTLHAYLGSTPDFGGAPPASLRPVESLEAFLVADFSPKSARAATPAARCAAASSLAAALVGLPGYELNPYPVTPFHADYLQHADVAARERATAQRSAGLAAAATAAAMQAPAGAGKLVLRAPDEARALLAKKGWTVTDGAGDADATVRFVTLESLLAPAAVRLNGWATPPWMKEGWFQAYRLLNDAAGEAAQKQARPLYERLLRGDGADAVETYNLERRLVAGLTRPCTRAVLGYKVRREYYNDDFSQGVENVSADGTLGLNSPVFVRTVKLKDYPWNGPLFLGIATKPEAAWNPIAGFSDPAGRFVWSVVGDDAFMAQPGNSGWIPNRIDAASSVTVQRKGGFAVPPEAVLPDPGTGLWRPVGPGKHSSVKILYRVLASPFHDGTEMDMADLLYAYAFAFRAAPAAGGDPALSAATSLIRERIVGIRPLGTQKRVDMVADIQVPRTTHLVEVYLNDGSLDLDQIAALAPPWSGVPWHLTVLMEEAVRQGAAAFSKDEAARKNVPWLDLVRNPALLERLKSIAAELERSKFRPAALAGAGAPAPVTPEDAAARWAALRKFADEHHHLLVTNGPYMLTKWTATATTFQVVRDFKYAVGIGAFDGFADSAVARVTGMQRKGNTVAVAAELEKMERMGRDATVIKEPLKHGPTKGFRPIRIRANSVLVNGAGKVVATSRPEWKPDGSFLVTLPKALPKEAHQLMVAVYADDNTVRADVGLLRLDPGAP